MDSVVLGLGQIGMGLDLKQDPKKTIGTHSRAISFSPLMNLVGGVDRDESRRQAFSAEYNAPAFNNLSAMFEDIHPDFVVVATPTFSHLKIFEELVGRGKPRLVLMEKPLGRTLLEAQEITRMARDANVSLAVNYLRRADISYSAVKALYSGEILEPPHRGVCWYTGGALNSASHFIDLLNGWFGPLELKGITAGLIRNSSDFAGDFVVGNQDLEVDFRNLNTRKGDHYSLHIYSQNGRLDYDLAGRRVSWSHSGPDQIYPELSSLAAMTETIESNFTNVMEKVYVEIGNKLFGHRHPSNLTTGDEALEVNRILDEVERAYS